MVKRKLIDTNHDKTSSDKDNGMNTATAAEGSGDKNVLKAVVSESNGEISCSVEETNRIRKLLGLKPLVLEKQNDETTAVNNYNEKKEQDKK